MKLNPPKVYFFLILFVVCFPTYTFATLQDKIFSKAKDTKSITSLFIQKRQISVLPLPLISKGKFNYHYEEGIVWEIQEPMQSKIIISKEGVQTEDNFAIAETKGSSKLSEILLSLFSGNLETLETYFYVDVKGDTNQWHLLLEPKNNLVAAQIASISIKGKESVESLYILESNGDSSSLVFTSSRINLLEENP
jgi:hypothetical protein|tara:strand:- start:3887 stop:4468 length:582 start_codon:yes stop_codon:yes gene_type:complete